MLNLTKYAAIAALAVGLATTATKPASAWGYGNYPHHYYGYYRPYYHRHFGYYGYRPFYRFHHRRRWWW